MMSSHGDANNKNGQLMQRSESQSTISHAIKRNIGSSTTSLTAFAVAAGHQPELQPVSLSPFEYATNGTSNNHAGYFNNEDALMNMNENDTMDFDTAYNMMSETLNTSQPVHDQMQIPRTPEQLHAALMLTRSPNQAPSARPSPQTSLLLDHRKAIIEAGLMNKQNMSSPGSPFQVSPHTRKLISSVNNLTSQYQMNNSGYELLSITESSALEKFLDSVVDDSKLSDLEKYWPSIDPLAKSESELTLPRLVTDPSSTNQSGVPSSEHYPLHNSAKQRLTHAPDLKLQKLDDTKLPLNGWNPIPASHTLPLSYNASPAQSPEPSVASSTTAIPIAAQKGKRGRKKKAIVKAESSNEEPPAKKVKAEDKTDSRHKRQVLTNEEKKFNHTESEKRRRALIKDAYDKLLNTIDVNKCYHLRGQNAAQLKEKKGKRGNSRFAVMNYVIEEIEWLTKENEMLRAKRCTHQS